MHASSIFGRQKGPQQTNGKITRNDLLSRQCGPTSTTKVNFTVAIYDDGSKIV